MHTSLPYRIERTRNRHSRATCLDDAILIRLAGGLTVRQEQEHIDTLLRRIGRSFLRLQSKTPVKPFESILEGYRGGTVRLADGRAYTFQFRDGTSLRAHFHEPSTWQITLPTRVNRRSVERLLWKALSRSEYDRMQFHVSMLNAQTLREQLPVMRLRFASSKWGSCSRRSLMLNTALLFVPPSAMDYVIIHELCHLVHANHSQRFWNEVERWRPGYREDLKAMKSYRLPKG